MRFLVFSDLHLSEQIGLSGGNTKLETSDGPRRRSLVEAERCLEWIHDRATEMDPDAILFAGDLYDRANPTPNEEAVALDAVQSLGDVAPTYLLLGNHEQSLGDDRSALASLQAARHPDLYVVESPRVVELDGARLYCLPYPALGRIVDPEGEGWSKEVRSGKVSRGLADIVEHFAASAADQEAPGVLFSHVTFGGCDYSEGRAVPMSDVRVPTDQIPAFDAVAAGHLHMRQTIGGLDRAWYVGPPDRWSFTDEGHPAGIARLDVDEDGAEWRFRAYPDARTFETIGPSELLDLEAGDVDAPDRTFLRIRGQVDDLEDVGALERARDELREEFGALRLDVSVPDDDREITHVDPTGGLRELFETYCEDRPDAIPDDREEDVLDAIEKIAE